MQITEITVKAGRVFNHPHESYSNLQPSIVLRAQIAPGEDVDACARALQLRAETLVETHKQGMLESIETLAETARVKGQIESIKSQLLNATDTLKDLEEQAAKLEIKPKMLITGSGE